MTNGDMARSYFDSMYADATDPWGFDTRFYEQRKYELTVASLTRPRYASAFEPGCSNGALTERLAERCTHLTACDIINGAVDRATERLRDHPHVDIVREEFPAYWPDRTLDLVVWSEVAYYLGPASLDDALSALSGRLQLDGELVVVNYTGETNYPQTADEVDAQIERSGVVERVTTLRCEQFRLDLWRCAGEHASP